MKLTEAQRQALFSIEHFLREQARRRVGVRLCVGGSRAVTGVRCSTGTAKALERRGLIKLGALWVGTARFAELTAAGRCELELQHGSAVDQLAALTNQTQEPA